MLQKMVEFSEMNLDSSIDPLLKVYVQIPNWIKYKISTERKALPNKKTVQPFPFHLAKL